MRLKQRDSDLVPVLSKLTIGKKTELSKTTKWYALCTLLTISDRIV